jgi:hypothetical protein
MGLTLQHEADTYRIHRVYGTREEGRRLLVSHCDAPPTCNGRVGSVISIRRLYLLS